MEGFRGGAGVGELLLAGLVRKIYHVSFPSLFWFSHLKTPLPGLSCFFAFCFPLSGFRVMETMKWIPGSKAGAGGGFFWLRGCGVH